MPKPSTNADLKFDFKGTVTMGRNLEVKLKTISRVPEKQVVEEETGTALLDNSVANSRLNRVQDSR